MSLPRALGLIAMLSLLAVPSAEAKLPVGEADGVRILRERGALVVKFTPRAEKLRRRVAGRLVTVYCTELLDESDSRFGSYSNGGGAYRVPKRGRTLRTGDLTRGLDYCRIAFARRSRERLVSVPLTQAGAVYLDEEEKAVSLLQILLVALTITEKQGLSGYPTYAQLIDFFSGLPRAPSAGRIADDIVALAGPEDTPAAGLVGYYSDGGERLAVVVVSRSERRLFLEYEPGGIVRTNVAPFIYGDLDP